MKKSFQVHILTNNKIIYEGEAVSLVAPGVRGYFGILANHASLVAAISDGKITIQDAVNNLKVINYQGKGFLEVLNNTVTLLLDSVKSLA